ncbi:peroxiredoxin [Wenzhouxiangella sp. AB-CW3]|uniref:peroxiredoxin n=1 Tax=Wenzhouxiangella sp. AB-CW3 TaxID=2771012 RepID=UPI00168B685B|nr:peroxiredoxin [Wenzhouxiangella sp. AB-CW3]QOC21161.1 peroxiredoxin [Wenzhouxiangella sp. AB-CW3]
MGIAAGERIPEAGLMVMTPKGPAQRTSTDLLGTGRVVLFAVPGPFTPTCSARHLPGFSEQVGRFLDAGIDRIVCMAVQDVFVMDAWARAAGADDRIVMAADGNGDFTRTLGLELDARAFGLGFRSQRFAMLAEDGVVRHLLVDKPGEFRVSSAEHLLGKL